MAEKGPSSQGKPFAIDVMRRVQVNGQTVLVSGAPPPGGPSKKGSQ